MDLIMLTFYNSREREESEWISLIKQVDGRFDVKIWPPQADMMAIIEATWRG